MHEYTCGHELGVWKLRLGSTEITVDSQILDPR